MPYINNSRYIFRFTNIDMGFHCKNITKEYHSRGRDVLALQGVDLSVGDREFVCIVGPSGCGKTTLLKIIAGLIPPTTGMIVNENQLDDTRPRSAMVFQDQGLFPWMSVEENVAFGLEMQNVTKPERLAKAGDFLRKVGLEEFSKSYPSELSGGMRQRVAILRAFLTNPEILLMDEPFGALDSQTRLLMQVELLNIWKNDQKTVIYITHDINEAIMLGDRVVVMSGRPGKIRSIFNIPLPRPRDLKDIEKPEIEAIFWRIWKMIEADVREEMKINL
jgi:NitT/TauT family transport system ATP-binding protein